MTHARSRLGVALGRLLIARSMLAAGGTAVALDAALAQLQQDLVELAVALDETAKRSEGDLGGVSELAFHLHARASLATRAER